MSGEDLLGALEGMVDEKPKAKSTATDRPELQILQETQQLLTEFAGIAEVFKLVDEKKKQLSEEFKDSVWTQFTDTWFSASGGRPKNPTIQSTKNGKPDCSAIFQLKAMFKVQVPQDGTPEDALKAVGFNAKTAKKIVDENVDTVVETGLRPFNELLNGKWVSGKGGKQFIEATEVEKAAAKKLLAYATAQGEGTVEVAPLTTEERAKAFQKNTSYVVKSGFLDRAVTYCKSADELRGLLTVITPQQAVSSVKFGKSDSADTHNGRMIDVFSELIAHSDNGLEIE